MNAVINLNHFKTLAEIDATYPDWRYMGRSGSKLEHMPDGTRVPRPLTGSALANPFKITSGVNREQAIQQYRHWLWKQIRRRNPAVLAALAQIGPETALACWCAPKHCHCHVIARAATWLREQQQEQPASPTAAAGTPRPSQRRKPPLPRLYPPGNHVVDLSDSACPWHPNAILSIFEGYKGRRYLAHQVGKRWCVPAPAPEEDGQAYNGAPPVTSPGTKVADAPAETPYSGRRTPCPYHGDQLPSECADGTYAWVAHQLPDGTWCRAD